MTIERQVILDELDDLFCQGVAIAAEVAVIRSWEKVSKRPLQVHRDIRAMAKQTGNPHDWHVALVYIVEKMQPLVDRQLAIQARTLELDRALTELNAELSRSYRNAGDGA